LPVNFKLKKLKDQYIYKKCKWYTFNKEEPIKYIVEVNIYYKRYRKRTEINIIREQK